MVTRSKIDEITNKIKAQYREGALEPLIFTLYIKEPDVRELFGQPDPNMQACNRLARKYLFQTRIVAMEWLNLTTHEQYILKNFSSNETFKALWNKVIQDEYDTIKDNFLRQQEGNKEYKQLSKFTKEFKEEITKFETAIEQLRERFEEEDSALIQALQFVPSAELESFIKEVKTDQLDQTIAANRIKRLLGLYLPTQIEQYFKENQVPRARSALDDYTKENSRLRDELLDLGLRSIWKNTEVYQFLKDHISNPTAETHLNTLGVEEITAWVTDKLREHNAVKEKGKVFPSKEYSYSFSFTLKTDKKPNWLSLRKHVMEVVQGFSPSDFAKTIFKDNSKWHEAVKLHRPLSASAIHVSLYCKVFAQFIEDIESPELDKQLTEVITA
jgi:hypothetical protein